MFEVIQFLVLFSDYAEKMAYEQHIRQRLGMNYKSFSITSKDCALIERQVRVPCLKQLVTKNNSPICY
jgi:hypothetical protein